MDKILIFNSLITNMRQNFLLFEFLAIEFFGIISCFDHKVSDSINIGEFYTFLKHNQYMLQ